MADEVQYGTDSLTDKRKYEDQTTPPWPATGFSYQPDSGDLPPPTNYNSIPPPVSDFEIAKQRAQEIAARFLTEAKRPRVENGGSGFDSVDSECRCCTEAYDFKYGSLAHTCFVWGVPGSKQKDRDTKWQSWCDYWESWRNHQVSSTSIWC
jgi:hypothetical protein